MNQTTKKPRPNPLPQPATEGYAVGTPEPGDGMTKKGDTVPFLVNFPENDRFWMDQHVLDMKRKHKGNVFENVGYKDVTSLIVKAVREFRKNHAK